jgi:putative nucleotidyltransferase with HDIG domain
MGRLYGECALSTLTLDQLVKHVEELPSLPDTTIKVLKLTEDPEASTRDIGNAIAADIAFTSRVLTIANSAYYGMPRSISTVQEAVLILGMQALRNLALAAATYDTLKKEMPGYCLGAGELWKHSVACAIAAQIIAKRTRAVRVEEAFVAGLLHDVGKVILNVYVGPQFEAIRALAELDGTPFFEGEKAVLGFDHAEVGSKIAEKWNLPGPLCSAIAGHHVLRNGDQTPELTAVVHVANLICRVDVLGLKGSGVPSPMDPAALDLLKLTERDEDEIRDEMIIQVDRAQPMFD